MKELLDITVSAYFEILDSEVYGGPGSTGYAALGMEKVELDGMEEKLSEGYLERLVQNMADMAKVPREKVRMISKEEYDLCTEEPDDGREKWSGGEL